MKNGSFYIPGREIERLRNAGLPPMPANPAIVDADGAEDEDQQVEVPRPDARQPRSRATQELYAEPSRQLARSQERTLRKEQTLHGKRLDIEIRRADQTDQEERERARLTREAQEWRKRCLQRVMDSGLSPELCVDTCSSVRKLLDTVPACTRVTTQIDQLIEAARRPERHRQEQDGAIEEALRLYLSRETYGNDRLKMQARSRTKESVRQLDVDASIEEVRAAAIDAAESFEREVEHNRACERVATWVLLAGSTDNESDQARQAVRESLGALPVGASSRRMTAARDAALQPFRQRIADREAESRAEQQRKRNQERRESLVRWTCLPYDLPNEDERRAREAIRQTLAGLPQSASECDMEAARDRAIKPFIDANARRKRKEELTRQALEQILPYIQKLEQEWEFSGKTAWSLCQEIREQIRIALGELLTGDESGDVVGRRLRRLVREALEV